MHRSEIQTDKPIHAFQILISFICRYVNWLIPKQPVYCLVFLKHSSRLKVPTLAGYRGLPTCERMNIVYSRDSVGP